MRFQNFKKKKNLKLNQVSDLKCQLYGKEIIKAILNRNTYFLDSVYKKV